MDGIFLTSRRHWWEWFNNTVIEFHLSETSGSCWVRTKTARLTDRDANDCAITQPPVTWVIHLLISALNSSIIKEIFRFIISLSLQKGYVYACRQSPWPDQDLFYDFDLMFQSWSIQICLGSQWGCLPYILPEYTAITAGDICQWTIHTPCTIWNLVTVGNTL